MERILSKIEIERKIGRVVFKMELRFEKCHVLKSEKFYRISFEENYVVSFNYSLLERINEIYFNANENAFGPRIDPDKRLFSHLSNRNTCTPR